MAGLRYSAILEDRITLMGGLSIWHWLIVLLVVVLLFGTKKLRNVGGDLGAAIKSFRQGLNEGTSSDEAARLKQDAAAAAKPETEKQNTQN